MLLQGILLVTVILLYPDLIQKSTSQQFVPSTCSSHDIEGFQHPGDLSTCDCQKKGQPVCKEQCSTTCPAGGKSQIYLNPGKCDMGCADDNIECNSCYIWFTALCQCLKDGPKTCAISSHSSSPAPPYWVRLNNADLATTTQRIPDILDLQNHQYLREVGWNFGQEQWTKGGQALAINSVHSKTQDQIHMHICPSNKFMRLFLSRLSSDTYCVSKYQSLQPVIVGGAGSVQVGGQASQQLCVNTGVNPNTGLNLSPYTMYCRTPGKTSIDGNSIASDIDTVIKGPGCADYVGAAVVVDYNDYTWLCVTNDRLDTEHRFCYNP